MINKLSYDTLHDIRDMLIQQIHNEQNKDKLLQLKNDRMIIEETIQKLFDVRYKERK